MWHTPGIQVCAHLSLPSNEELGKGQGLHTPELTPVHTHLSACECVSEHTPAHTHTLVHVSVYLNSHLCTHTLGLVHVSVYLNSHLRTHTP